MILVLVQEAVSRGIKRRSRGPVVLGRVKAAFGVIIQFSVYGVSQSVKGSKGGLGTGLMGHVKAAFGLVILVLV